MSLEFSGSWSLLTRRISSASCVFEISIFVDETLGLNLTIIFASFLFIGETFFVLRFTCMLIFPSTKLLRFCVQAFTSYWLLQVIKFMNLRKS